VSSSSDNNQRLFCSLVVFSVESRTFSFDRKYGTIEEIFIIFIFMSWQEKLRQFSSEKFPTHGTMAMESKSAPKISLLQTDRIKKLESYEKNIKLINAYYEHCIDDRPDGESFAALRNAQDPIHFSSRYPKEKIDRDIDTLNRIKHSAPSFFARVAESTLWELQKDYGIFGEDVDIMPSSDFDDKTRGVDLIVLKGMQGDKKSAAVFIDATLVQGLSDASKALLEYKTNLHFARRSDERDAFKYGGVIRRVDYLSSPRMPHDTPGLEAPAIVVSLSEDDLFDVVRLVMNGDTMKPRNKGEVRNDPRFMELKERFIQKILNGLEVVENHMDKEESTRRISGRDTGQLSDLYLQKGSVSATKREIASLSTIDASFTEDIQKKQVA